MAARTWELRARGKAMPKPDTLVARATSATAAEQIWKACARGKAKPKSETEYKRPPARISPLAKGGGEGGVDWQIVDAREHRRQHGTSPL